MIRHLPLRIAASLVTLAAVLPAHPCHAQAAPALDPTVVQLPHISVRTVGHGSPVILIPGLASPRATWNGVWPALARAHRVHLVQVNGFGGDAPGANLSPGMLDGIVADLDHYITENQLHGTAVIGHSMGGTLTLMLAKAHPGNVGKALIVDAIPFTADIFAPGIPLTVEMVQPRAVAIRDQMAAAYGKPADPAAAAKTASTQAIKPDSQAKVVTFITAADPRVTAEAFYEDITTDLRPAMPSLTVPITVLFPWNGSDEAHTESFYRGEYAAAKTVSFVPVADSGHFVMFDQPAAFMTAVQVFLAR
jgi:pimeloyl-ACP methyl ester carboxylesterase